VVDCSNTAFTIHGYQNCHLVQKLLGESDIHTGAHTQEYATTSRLFISLKTAGRKQSMPGLRSLCDKYIVTNIESCLLSS